MWIIVFVRSQPGKNLKMSNHEERSPSLMGKNQMRQIYHVTYRQADKPKFPGRECFGEEIAKAFVMDFFKGESDYRACSPEPHKEGGVHYVSIKLSGVKKMGGC